MPNSSKYYANMVQKKKEKSDPSNNKIKNLNTEDTPWDKFVRTYKEKIHIIEISFEDLQKRAEERWIKTLQNVGDTVEHFQFQAEQWFEETKTKLIKKKLRVWKIFLTITILCYVFGFAFGSYGTFSPYYSIQRVNFTNEISYNRAIANQDLLFQNVSILPDDLEIFSISAYLLIPKGHHSTPMPGIVWSHGMVVNAEANLHNAMEFAAAGFVVLATNLAGHGDTGGYWDFGLNDLQVIWSGVEYLSQLDIVDPNQIAVVGHSNGGMAVTRAAIFDKTSFGTGGKIKSVGAIWAYTDLKDTLTNALGTNVVDDPKWGVLISTFLGCSDGMITSDDVLRRSIKAFINETNIPNYYLMTGDKDDLTNLSIQFDLFETCTGGTITSEELNQLYTESNNFSWNNTQDPNISFLNGTARKISILQGQDHIEEVLVPSNSFMMIDWLVNSMQLDANDHIGRNINSVHKIEVYYTCRIIGGWLILSGSLLAVITLGFIISRKIFPKVVENMPEFIPLIKDEENEEKYDGDIFCLDNGQEFKIDYVGKDPIAFINSWKKKILYLSLIVICFIGGISISWLVKQYFLHFWLINVYLWQYFWTGIFLSIATISMYFMFKRGEPHTKRLKLKKLGLSKSGFFNGLLFVLIVTGIPLILYNILALLLKYPKIIPRPFSISLWAEVLVTLLMTFLFYFNLEIISKTQLFEKNYAYPTFKGYLQEIFINGSLIWLMWLISYLIGGIFLNSRLKWLLFQGNVGSATIIVIGLIMIGFQGFMAYMSAFFYQQTHNIFVVTLVQAVLMTLLMTGKYIFIYSIL